MGQGVGGESRGERWLCVYSGWGMRVIGLEMRREAGRGDVGEREWVRLS